jgi:hypothetical protein
MDDKTPRVSHAHQLLMHAKRTKRTMAGIMRPSFTGTCFNRRWPVSHRSQNF